MALGVKYRAGGYKRPSGPRLPGVIDRIAHKTNLPAHRVKLIGLAVVAAALLPLFIYLILQLFDGGPAPLTGSGPKFPKEKRIAPAGQRLTLVFPAWQPEHTDMPLPHDLRENVQEAGLYKYGPAYLRLTVVKYQVAPGVEQNLQKGVAAFIKTIRENPALQNFQFRQQTLSGDNWYGILAQAAFFLNNAPYKLISFHIFSPPDNWQVNISYAGDMARAEELAVQAVRSLEIDQKTLFP